ncbi:DUF192 domain-containing protein [Acetobacter sp. TBRC 12305]|uniref:DUF192 domain-containing protein n=1 Tax=Acetobacter garciniae TaxID=2817435 RepID=A0A939HKB9_9PROT|nr:DUF192 domain-containing protein [Acetobacter garciniae]MBO1326015.1 DUF192 domain-containing protein [Acetobacter garciniae]MBX0345241.1 DUF192 domain-containing protein [Acetobacter garciniae]
MAQAAAPLLPALADDTGEPTQAQPTLPQEKLSITSASGPHAFTVELARTPRQQQVGEMFRTQMPENTGMLFVWSIPRESDMWMENTLIPLDIVFIGTDHRIHAIEENAVPRSLAQISSQGPVLATLELAGGVAAKLGLTVGDKVDSPSLNAPSPGAAAPSTKP